MLELLTVYICFGFALGLLTYILAYEGTGNFHKFVQKTDECIAIGTLSGLFWPLLILVTIIYYIFKFCMVFVRLYEKYLN